MRKKYNIIQIIIKVYRQTLKVVPFSGILGILNYLAQGLFPAFTALILARLFNDAYNLSRGINALPSMILYGALFVMAYVIVYIMQFACSITINAGIYANYSRKPKGIIMNAISIIPYRWLKFRPKQSSAGICWIM